MRLGILFSGGKDSTYAAFLAKKYGHELACLISINSSNPDSYMFHTPSISGVEVQARAMNIPIIVRYTAGEKEIELDDLELAIKDAIEQHNIEGIVTGALESVYQATRIQKICNKLKIECFNPLWQKDQIELLKDLIENNFKVIITGVFAYPLDEAWLEREIDDKFIEDIIKVRDEFKINPAGEGGEFETFVVDCPLYENEIKYIDKKISGEKNSFRMELIF